MIQEVVVPVSAPNVGQFLPQILGALFFAGVAYLLYKLMPKAMLLVLVVLALVLFFAFKK